MKKVSVLAELRDKVGKGPARSLRREGKIPGVLYSEGKSLLLTLDPKELRKIISHSGGENALLNLNIQGNGDKKERTAIFRDFQYNPVSGALLHVDFFEVAMDLVIHVKVPVEILGVPTGVKSEGGVLHAHLRELEVACLPLKIPEKISVDVSGMGLGEFLTVKDLNLEEGIQVLGDTDLKIASVDAPMSEEKLEALLSAPAEAEVKEPDVVGKEKKEEEPAKGEVKKEEPKK